VLGKAVPGAAVPGDAAKATAVVVLVIDLGGGTDPWAGC
jgi:hypothetical protein